MIVIKNGFMVNQEIIYNDRLIGFSCSGSGVLNMHAEGIGTIMFSTTWATDEVLTVCKDLMARIREHPDQDFLITPDTFQSESNLSVTNI